MPKKYPSGGSGAKRVEEPKVAMSYRLSRDKIARAQRLLGTPTATATIEEALDLVAFRRELLDGVNSLSGMTVRDAFPGSGRRKRRWVATIGRRRYVIDTHLYIDALRTEQGKHALNDFQSAFAPFLHFSAVVAQELRAGVRAADAQRLEAGLFAPYERRGRLIAPSYGAWKEAGRVLGELVGPSQWRSVTRSFVNDVLLAMSCREAGAVLVTGNTTDFARIAAARRFEFIAPWPWAFV
jgi:predicted nucleic acid-binding protein